MSEPPHPVIDLMLSRGKTASLSIAKSHLKFLIEDEMVKLKRLRDAAETAVKMDVKVTVKKRSED